MRTVFWKRVLRKLGDPICLYTRQKNADGTFFTVAVSARLGPNTVEFFQTDNWKEIGGKFVGHLEGTMVCSTSVKHTQTLMNPDESLFNHYIQVNGDMIPDVPAMVKNACVKVSRKVCSEVVPKYASHEKIPEKMAVEAFNLTCVDFTEDRFMEFMDDSKYDYYVVGSWTKGQEEKLRDLPDDDIRIKALIDKRNKSLVWEDDDTRVVNVYALKKPTEQSTEQEEKKQKS